MAYVPMRFLVVLALSRVVSSPMAAKEPALSAIIGIAETAGVSRKLRAGVHPHR